jgi:hypothetical protein
VTALCQNIRTAIRDSDKSFADVAAALDWTPAELEEVLATPEGPNLEEIYLIALAIGAGETFPEWFREPDERLAT